MKRLYSLDALRGLAALAVVVWHWQHFFALSGDYPDGWRRDSQPFYAALRPFYDGGWVAVGLFFVLSGFIFFWLYADAIKTRAVRPGSFARLRFSRLYPLHVATLVLTAGLDALFWRHTGSCFIYDCTNGPRFAAGLLMAQQWLPPTTDQFFNGPAWSVSVEVLLYILFFAACRLGLTGPRQALILAACGGLVMPFNGLIGGGVIGFFLGGATWHFTAWAAARSDVIRIARWTAGLSVLAWAAAVAEVYGGVLHRLTGASSAIFGLVFVILVGPVTVAALALHEHQAPGRWKVLSFLGDISYSTYLLHFPLQLACVLAALQLGWTPQAFMTPLAMSAFFATLIALGAASHYGFERPMQRLLRGKLRRATPAV